MCVYVCAWKANQAIWLMKLTLFQSKIWEKRILFLGCVSVRRQPLAIFSHVFFIIITFLLWYTGAPEKALDDIWSFVIPKKKEKWQSFHIRSSFAVLWPFITISLSASRALRDNLDPNFDWFFAHSCGTCLVSMITYVQCTIFLFPCFDRHRSNSALTV